MSTILRTSATALPIKIQTDVLLITLFGDFDTDILETWEITATSAEF